MAQLEVAPAIGGGVRPLARVQLSYRDEFAQRPVMVEQVISAEMAADLAGYDPTWDLEILRNVTIQQMAEGMREIDRLFQAGQYEPAWQLAVGLEARLTEVARLTGDKQMLEDVALMQRYQETLADAVWRTQSRAPRLPDSRPETGDGRPYRGRSDDDLTPTPPVPTVILR
jgi:hypothetical protein